MSHIALIFGGPSAEHDVSLVSAKNILQALEETQFKVSLLGVTKDSIWKLIKPDDLKKTDFVTPLDLSQCGIEVKLSKTEDGVFIESTKSEGEKLGPIDVAFPIAHGPYGEDGSLQNELTQLGLSFVGSEALACEAAFDKGKTKSLMKEHGIPQVPFFVKPANMGSSVGIAKVRTEAELHQAIADARIFDGKIIIEKGVDARGIECALIEDPELQVSGLGEIKSNHDFYSYEAKYLDPNGAELIIPAILDDSKADEIKELAKKCFTLLGCRDFVRADFFLTKDGEIYFNEINTHPGCTNISLFPMLWKHEGLSYKDLVMKLVNNAVKRQKGK